MAIWGRVRRTWCLNCGIFFFVLCGVSSVCFYYRYSTVHTKSQSGVKIAALTLGTVLLIIAIGCLGYVFKQFCSRKWIYEIINPRRHRREFELETSTEENNLYHLEEIPCLTPTHQENGFSFGDNCADQRIQYDKNITFPVAKHVTSTIGIQGSNNAKDNESLHTFQKICVASLEESHPICKCENETHFAHMWVPRKVVSAEINATEQNQEEFDDPRHEEFSGNMQDESCFSTANFKEFQSACSSVCTLPKDLGTPNLSLINENKVPLFTAICSLDTNQADSSLLLLPKTEHSVPTLSHVMDIRITQTGFCLPRIYHDKAPYEMVAHSEPVTMTEQRQDVPKLIALIEEKRRLFEDRSRFFEESPADATVTSLHCLMGYKEPAAPMTTVHCLMGCSEPAACDQAFAENTFEHNQDAATPLPSIWTSERALSSSELVNTIDSLIDHQSIDTQIVLGNSIERDTEELFPMDREWYQSSESSLCSVFLSTAESSENVQESMQFNQNFSNTSVESKPSEIFSFLPPILEKPRFSERSSSSTILVGTIDSVLNAEDNFSPDGIVTHDIEEIYLNLES